MGSTSRRLEASRALRRAGPEFQHPASGPCAVDLPHHRSAPAPMRARGMADTYKGDVDMAQTTTAPRETDEHNALPRCGGECQLAYRCRENGDPDLEIHDRLYEAFANGPAWEFIGHLDHVEAFVVDEPHLSWLDMDWWFAEHNWPDPTGAYNLSRFLERTFRGRHEHDKRLLVEEIEVTQTGRHESSPAASGGRDTSALSVTALVADRARPAIVEALEVVDRVGRLGHTLSKLESTVEVVGVGSMSGGEDPCALDARLDAQHEKSGTRALRDLLGEVQYLTVEALEGHVMTELSWEGLREIRERWT